MSRPAFQIARWIPGSTPLTRHIVKEILRRENRPLHNREIWDLSVGYKLSQKEALLHEHDLKKYAPNYKVDSTRREVPPRPENPIRSLRYLKTYVLDDLKRRGEIVQILIKREPTPAEKAAIAMQPAMSRKKRKRVANMSGRKQPPTIIDGLIVEFKWRLAEEGELKKEKYIYEAKERLAREGEQRILDQIGAAPSADMRRKAESNLLRLRQSVKNGTYGPFKNIRPRMGQDENGFLPKKSD